MGISNTKGDIGELAVAKKCLEKGWHVAITFGDDAPYDLVVDTHEQMHKVQVKYVAEKNGCLDVKFESSTHVSYKEKADIIAVYCPDSDSVYWINLANENNQTTLRLRTQRAKNNQNSNVVLAEKYLMRV